MTRRKRPSLRRLKARFVAGKPISRETVLDFPRLEDFIRKRGYRATWPMDGVVRQ